MLKFDTLDKKPKLYDAAALTVPVLAFLVYALKDGIDEPAVDARVIEAVLVVYFAALIVMLVRAFFGQIRYNPYSYNTIIYVGFALFALSVLAVHIWLLGHMLADPDNYTTYMIIGVLAGSAEFYMFLSFPFLAVFSAALCISNISLIRHEGRRLVNLLGIALSFLIIGGAVFLYRFDFYATGSLFEVMMHNLVANSFSAVYLYFECMLIGTIAANIIAVRYEPEKDKDFMIILGCGIRKDGTPTPLLRGRCDRALAFYRRQKEETGRELTFVVSGGQGPHEVTTESSCMRNYLLSQGIPEERIVEENRSTDTLENMRFSKEIIGKINPAGKVAFSTTNYHIFRSGICARRVKMRAVGIGARTKWYFWPNAAVREFVGLLAEHRGKQAFIMVGLLAVYFVLTLLCYL